MPKRFFYDHGLPFTEKLSENLDDLKARVEGNKAAMIVIDGQVGEGKTTLAVQTGDYIQGSPIDLKNQLALGGGDFTKKLKYCYSKGHPVLVYDEAGDFNKRGALTKFNAMINRVFETYRTYNIIVVLCLPSLYSLDETLFEKGIVRLVLHVHDRNENNGQYQGYSLYRAHYLRENMRKLVVKPFAYKRVHPNFRGHFLDLEPERSKQLDRISTKGKLDILDEGEILYHGLVNTTDIRAQLDRSASWVQEKLSLLQAKPLKRYKARKYYDASIVEKLAELVVYEKDGTEVKRKKDKPQKKATKGRKGD